MSPRDRRFSKTIGRKPFSGHRYVLNGDVWIEFGADRETRLIGPNTKETRDKADQVLEAATSRARAIALGQAPASTLTLAELVAKYRADALTRPSPVTGQPIRARTLALYQEYEGWILAFFGGATIASELRRGRVRDWITQLRDQGTAEGVIARAVDHLKSLYRWAIAGELLEVNPIAELKSPPRRGAKPIYSPAESQLLLETLDALPIGRAWRFRLYVLLDAIYGVRAHQPLALQWRDPADVDFDRVFDVTTPAGQRVQLVGGIRFAQRALGSKGQPDRWMPMLPAIRVHLLEAWNHRRPESPWVFWNWRRSVEACPLASMYEGLHKLEEAAKVERITGRGWHAFRRAMSTLLVRRLGVVQASKWIADTPQVLMRNYVIPGDEDQAESAAFIMDQLNLQDSKSKLQTNRKRKPTDMDELAASLEMRGRYRTGPAGLEPATPSLPAEGDGAVPLYNEGNSLPNPAEIEPSQASNRKSTASERPRRGRAAGGA